MPRGPKKKIQPVIRTFGKCEVVGFADGEDWTFRVLSLKSDAKPDADGNYGADSYDETLLDRMMFKGSRDDTLLFMGGLTSDRVRELLTAAKEDLALTAARIEQQIKSLV